MLSHLKCDEATNQDELEIKMRTSIYSQKMNDQPVDHSLTKLDSGTVSYVYFENPVSQYQTNKKPIVINVSSSSHRVKYATDDNNF